MCQLPCSGTDPVPTPLDLAATSCSRRQRQDEILAARCLQGSRAALLLGRTTSPSQPPGGACLSWCPCGCPFPTCGPSIDWGGDGCSAPGRSCSAHGSSSAPSPLEMKVGSENEETGNCQIPWQPRSGRSTLQNIYFFTFYSHCTVIAPEHLCQYVCKLADARHWMEFKGEGKGDLFCVSQGLGGLWRTNQF